MPSRINVNVPAYKKSTTQTVRDNFAIASAEITELQARTSLEEVPIDPVGEVWVRQRGAWLPLATNNGVDGGTF